MDAIRQKALELLEAGEVKAVIGYARGTGGTRRPLVARNARQLEKLIFDEGCTQNLAGLLAKHEIRHLGKLALVARGTTLRSLLQLMAERQLKDGEVTALVEQNGTVKALSTGSALEEHLALEAHTLSPEDQALMQKLCAMTREERWAFWQAELSRCVKCYACRQTCPMCYCGHCTMDGNRPQWVAVPSHAVGNFEYHIVRAMHLAGRCVQCGECGKACPVGIPVHLLTIHAEESSAAQFGQKAGHSAKLDYALSTFKPNDKESFIR